MSMNPTDAEKTLETNVASIQKLLDETMALAKEHGLYFTLDLENNQYVDYYIDGTRFNSDNYGWSSSNC